jgi:membrane peptidoglycan carboxypeptidase
VLASEDPEFFLHRGFSRIGIENAVRTNLMLIQESNRNHVRLIQESNRDHLKLIRELIVANMKLGKYVVKYNLIDITPYYIGGSTITQQLAKNLYLKAHKGFRRKIKEAIITWQMERRLSKPRILEIYLNVIEFGEGIYGIEAAARHYCSKNASSLSLCESCFLAAILPGPLGLYDPLKHPDNVTNRQKILLRLMESLDDKVWNAALSLTQNIGIEG